MLDLQPATSALAALVTEVRDDQLVRPTPCPHTTVGDMLDHVRGFAEVFAAAGTKTTRRAGSRATRPDAGNLGPEWRDQVADQVAALGRAWRPASAWEGSTEAGGGEMPAAMAGVVALNEVIVHGWDIAVATGLPFVCELELVEAAFEFAETTAHRYPEGSPGLFGPPVPVSEEAPLLDRLVGLTGRDPAWQPSGLDESVRTP